MKQNDEIVKEKNKFISKDNIIGWLLDAIIVFLIVCLIDEIMTNDIKTLENILVAACVTGVQISFDIKRYKRNNKKETDYRI